MSPRRISALLCLICALLIAWGVLADGWWSMRMGSSELRVEMKIGLVGLSGCKHEAGRTQCESLPWKQIGVPVGSGLWVWSGRLLFGVAIASAVALAVTALL